VAAPEGKGRQMTYNGWPLYYYIKDKAPGDTTGQGVGGTWFVVPPDQAKNT
jgi:predicted lipoprotein with Yx(FWY)xxD motif